MRISQCKTAGYLSINGKTEQRSFEDRCEVASARAGFFVMLFNEPQRFPQLQHSGEFVLAGVTARWKAEESIE